MKGRPPRARPALQAAAARRRPQARGGVATSCTHSLGTSNGHALCQGGFDAAAARTGGQIARGAGPKGPGRRLSRRAHALRPVPRSSHTHINNLPIHPAAHPEPTNRPETHPAGPSTQGNQPTNQPPTTRPPILPAQETADFPNVCRKRCKPSRTAQNVSPHPPTRGPNSKGPATSVTRAAPAAHAQRARTRARLRLRRAPAAPQ